MTDLTKTLGSVGLLLFVCACTNNLYEVPIETPLQPKLDVSAFQRVLIAGFVTGGTNEVDANLETARLLRSHLRTESRLDVIDSEVIDLFAVAEDESATSRDAPEVESTEKTNRPTADELDQEE